MAEGVGFITDYFGEVLARLRGRFPERSAEPDVRRRHDPRDQVAIERITSGLVKLIYPDGKMTDEERREVVTLACELRQRVTTSWRNWLRASSSPPAHRLVRHDGRHAAKDLQVLGRQVSPQEDRLNHESMVGMTTGLSVLMRDGKIVGGDLILIQVSAFSGKRAGDLSVTGLHGQVLQDSVRTAYNVVRSPLFVSSASTKSCCASGSLRCIWCTSPNPRKDRLPGWRLSSASCLR